MNREQKAAAIAEIAGQLKESEAVFAVDYRGISVPQAAELRVRLRDADATFRVVKNTLTERAADDAGADTLKTLLEGPTALTFVHGDAALAAKAIATFARETDTLAFKGGLLGAEAVDADQILAISRLPARDVLYGQLVGLAASPITGLVRGLNALIAGLAIQLSQINEKKQSGEIPAGEPPAGMAEAAAPDAEAAASEGEAGASDAEAAAPETEPAPPAAEAAAPAADAPAEEAAAEQAPAETATEEAPDTNADASEPAASSDQPAEGDTTSDTDNEADASA
jgi:large subunit ribosomal protein L10